MADFQSLKGEIKNWDLTSDEKLLSKLDSFLNQVIDQCGVISKNAQQAEYEANAVSVYLGDTFNALSNLSNKKFIENSMAPFEESAKPAENKDKPVVSQEKKMENYQKALNHAINVFGITSNDDDDLLTKSHTMSMAMFKSADHLPFIVGSKAFAQDEFLGIIDRNEKDSKYLRGVGQEAPVESSSSGNENFNASPASGAQNGSMSYTNFKVEIDGATNITEIRNTTLGPPPPLDSLLSQSSSWADTRGAGGRGALLDEIANRGGAAGGRGNMMAEINARGNLMNEINARGNLMDEIKNRGNPDAGAAGGRANMLAQINARGNMMEEIASRGRMQTDAAPAGGRANMMAEINARGNLMNDIANRGRLQTDAGRPSGNPMFQAITQVQPQSNRLFDDDEEDVEVGNTDMFKSSNANKKKFENLLGNPMGGMPGMGGPMGGMGNPLGFGGSNPLGTSNPFDPFGIQNPFMPFQPKSEIAQAAAEKPVPKAGGNPMMNLASEIQAAAAGRKGNQEDESKANKLNKLFEDSDEDEEARLNKQKQLSQQYRGETKVQTIEKTAPVSRPSARVSKLFDDEEEDMGFAARKNTAPIKKEAPVSKPAAKKKMFDDDDEIKEEDETPIQKKAADEDNESPARRSKTMAGKGMKPSLFDDEDDDAPIGGGRQSKAPAVQSKKKTLFDDDDEDDGGFGAKKSVAPKPSIQKKTLFDEEEEEKPVVKPVVQEIKPKPVVVQEVREEPKVVIPEPKKVVVEEVIRQPEPEPVKPVQPVVEEKKEVVATTAPAEEENRGVRAPTTTNLTQLIKASQLNRKKKHFGGSSEEDSDSDEDAAPVRKPQPAVVRTEPAVVVEAKVEEEPKPEIKEEPVVVTPPVVVETKAEEEEVKPEVKPEVVEEKPKNNMSSKIAALQNQLNLNADMFKPGGGEARKPKVSIQPSESVERKEENLAPGQLSHTAALAKPKQQARAKKTIMFDDDEEEEVKKPADKFVSNTYVPPSKPQVQETPVQQYTPAPVQQQQPQYSAPVYEEPRASTTKKVAFKDDSEEEQVNSRPSYNQTQAQPSRPSTTSGSDNPMALLSGLKALDENKGSGKSARPSTKKAALYDDDEEEEKPKPIGRPSGLGAAPSLGGGDNPMALLSGLKNLDAEQGRKSTKGKKGKGIFDDDEDDAGFAPKKEEPRKSNVTQPRASTKMNKLFDDSDEDKNQDWGRKSESPMKNSSKPAASNRRTLFDDDD